MLLSTRLVHYTCTHLLLRLRCTCRYLLKEKRLVKVGYDAMLTFNAQKSSSGKRDFMQGIIDA